MGVAKPVIFLRAWISIPNFVIQVLSVPPPSCPKSGTILWVTPCMLQEYFNASQENFTSTPQTPVNPVRALHSYAVLEQQGIKTYLKNQDPYDHIGYVAYIVDTFASHPWSWELLSRFHSVTMSSGPNCSRSPWTTWEPDLAQHSGVEHLQVQTVIFQNTCLFFIKLTFPF